MTAVFLGKVLILGGCAALGVLKGQELKDRTACLTEFRWGLGGLARELSFALRPLPELAAGVHCQGPAGTFFALCQRLFWDSGGESWSEAWEQALVDCPLPLTDEDCRLLTEAGEVLGRYDGDSQRQALDAILSRLDENAAQAKAEEGRLYRVWLVLGVTAGLFAWVLL